MFDVMGWAPNSRSYNRLRDVLRPAQVADDPLRKRLVGRRRPRLRRGSGEAIRN